MRSISIVYLYNEVMGYNLSVFRELLQDERVKLFVVHWDRNKLTPFEFTIDSPRIEFRGRSEFDRAALLQFVLDCSPSLLFVSGWRDRDYTYVSTKLKGMKIPVVTGMDNHWRGTLKQRLLCILSKFTVRRYFSHVFVAGIYQYEYARRLGFDKRNILTGMLSADNCLFNSAYIDKNKHSKNILYVGRLAGIKRVHWIYDSFKSLEEEFPDWTLTIIGNGPESRRLVPTARIKVVDFLPPEKLVDFVKEASFFVHTSEHEPWGLVIHEMACAGLPILTSDECGAASQFVINGYNGYLFPVASREIFEKKLRHLMGLSDETRMEMGAGSYKLSSQLSPEIVSQKILSLLITDDCPQ